MVHISALLSVQRIVPGSSTALSILVMCRTIPEVIISPLGGILADKFDRKNLMIKLDMLAAICVLSYIYAVREESIYLFYGATIIRSSITATYHSITNSIVPQLVSDPEDLKRAATINGFVWSGMLAVGGVIAGWASARIGVEVCFFIDSVTYLMSACVISNVSGSYKVEPSTSKVKGPDVHVPESKMSLRTLIRMSTDTFTYLWQCGFGLLVLLKASGCLIWGSSDVLNVSFAQVDGDEAETSRRMGALYSSIGIGCLIGPIIANSTVVHGKQPRTLQLAIIGGLVFMTAGWLGVGGNTSSFKMICAFTMVRTIGSSIMWLFSTLLLQVSNFISTACTFSGIVLNFIRSLIIHHAYCTEPRQPRNPR